MNSIIILGTSRKNGNTQQLVELYTQVHPAKVIDLSNYSITPYDYAHNNQSDDYLSLMEEVLKFKHIVFATPVYWYSMSAQMKTFVDRFSDLLTTNQELGRQLRGKSCSLIATGSDEVVASCFEQAFKLTAEYLGMNYTGLLYCACNENFDAQKYRDVVQKYINNVTLKN